MPRVEIDIEGDLLDKMSEGFFWEESSERPATPLDPNVAALIVARVNGLKIKIWADEHPPPHFHVNYQGEDASFSILDCSRLRGTRGLERYERCIQSWWSDNRQDLVEKWNLSRPAGCPVGPIRLPPNSN
jgi:hypothetical protein